MNNRESGSTGERELTASLAVIKSQQDSDRRLGAEDQDSLLFWLMMEQMEQG